MARISSLLIAGVALSLLPLLGNCLSDIPSASSLNGTYLGIHNSYYGVDAFLGIPYAQPPLSALRYRAPQPLNSSWTGAKNATKFGDQCVGYGVSNERICILLLYIITNNLSGYSLILRPQTSPSQRIASC